jgi:8-oxo-dGTP pyrophosphatase MutT (NUDIX family)
MGNWTFLEAKPMTLKPTGSDVALSPPGVHDLKTAGSVPVHAVFAQGHPQGEAGLGSTEDSVLGPAWATAPAAEGKGVPMAPGVPGKTMNSKVTPVPDDLPDNKCWDVTVKRSPSGRASEVTIESERHGTVSYGLRDGLYPSWVFREVGGGGAVTLPFVKDPNGKVLIGLLLEDRPNMGGKRWCIPGGFIDPGETHVEAGMRETLEEVGVFQPPVLELEGPPINPNRAFFDADPSKGEGVRAFGMELPYAWLVPGEQGTFHLADGIQVGVKSPKNLTFFTARDAIHVTGDGFAAMAIGKLLAPMY